MSKDKYSNDHHIVVAGDTNTVFVKDNLDVAEDLTTKNLTISEIFDSTGASTTTGDLLVDGYIQVNDIDAHDIVASNVSRSSPANKYLNIPAATSNTCQGSATFDSAGAAAIIAGSGTWQAAHDLLDLPHQATIETIVIRYTPGDSSGFTAEASVWRRHKLTGVSEEVASATAISGTVSVFNVANEFNIDHIVDNQLHTYWLTFNGVAGTSTLKLHEATVVVSVTDYD